MCGRAEKIDQHCGIVKQLIQLEPIVRTKTGFKPFCFKALAALALSLSLSACGFHLLGSTGSTQQGIGWGDMPHTVAFVGDADSAIAEHLKQQKPANISYAPSDKADLTLDMSGISTGKSVLSANSAGTTTEYRVTMSVIVQMYDAHKNQLLAPTRLSTSRNLIVGSGYATAEDAEYERLYADMAQELANSIAYRVRAVWFTRNQQTKP